MTPEATADLVRSWRGWNFYDDVSEDLVLATDDWMSYVLAMAHAMPPDLSNMTFPTEEDVRWAWPNGVTIVFSRPLDIEHIIISHTTVEEGQTWNITEPAYENHRCVAFAVLPRATTPSLSYDESGVPFPTSRMLTSQRVICIGEDPADLVAGHWAFGERVNAAVGMPYVDFYHRLSLSLITALGHKLTTIAAPSGLGRAAGRRLARKLPALRVLELTSGAAVSSKGGSVEWSRRWFVRGHWRDQACGPGMSLRKLIWIDPYIKGPSDKPLDIRETVWETAL